MTTPTRFGLSAAVTMAMIMAGAIRAALPVLGTDIRLDLGLTRTEFGALLTTFLVALAVSAPLTGRLADVLGGRRTLFLRFAIAGAGLLLTASAPGLWWLAAAVAFTGMGLSAGNPATNKLIADHVAPGSRGTIMGVKQSGGQVGVLLAGATLPVIAAASSWRVAAGVVVVMPAIAAVLLAALVPPDPPRRAWGSSARLGSEERTGLRQLLLLGALMGAAVQSTFGFLPLFAVERVGVSTTTAGLVTAVVAANSSVGRIFWAWAGERSGTVATPAALLTAGAVGGVTLLALAPTAGAWALWAGAVVLGATAESWNAIANFAVIGVAGAASTGRASGVLNSVTLGTGAVGPILFGVIVDATDSYTPAWIGCGLLFATASVVAARWRA